MYVSVCVVAEWYMLQNSTYIVVHVDVMWHVLDIMCKDMMYVQPCAQCIQHTPAIICRSSLHPQPHTINTHTPPHATGVASRNCTTPHRHNQRGPPQTLPSPQRPHTTSSHPPSRPTTHQGGGAPHYSLPPLSAATHDPVGGPCGPPPDARAAAAKGDGSC